MFSLYQVNENMKKQLILDTPMRIVDTELYILAGRTEVTNEAPTFITYHPEVGSDYRVVGLLVNTNYGIYDPSTDYVYVPPAKAELKHQDDNSVLYEFDLIASETGIKVTHNGSEVVNGQTFEVPNFKLEWTTYETDPNTLDPIPQQHRIDTKVTAVARITDTDFNLDFGGEDGSTGVNGQYGQFYSYAGNYSLTVV